MGGRLVEFGISDFGFAFGEDQDVEKVAKDYVDDPERVLQWGCTTFHRAPDGVYAVDLAAKAAEQALERAGIGADELDLVALATAENPEYLYWDSASALAGALKVKKTQTLLFDNEGCGAGTTAFGQIAGTLALQPELNTALFVVVNRVDEYRRNRMAINQCVHSDGAVAVVLRRGHGSNRWLTTEQFTDPDLVDGFRGEYGGAVNPVPPADWKNVDGSSVGWFQAHFGRDPKRLREFLVQRDERVAEIVDQACARVGLTRADLDHVIYINDARPGAIEAVSDPLGLPIERTNAEFARTHGHMGAADQLVSLGLHLERGDLKPGEIVALCGISAGMRWICTLFEI
ncbi:3-oxoacyl-ACP synthase III family protein [Streptomyces sioyaensis]|uniref:3-oxoacyl-ACP synthase III family protein n=1 Tax=Streptomyces sioyaensis TaxID=67364 RepID=UPI00378B5CCE